MIFFSLPLMEHSYSPCPILSSSRKFLDQINGFSKWALFLSYVVSHLRYFVQMLSSCTVEGPLQQDSMVSGQQRHLWLPWIQGSISGFMLGNH